MVLHSKKFNTRTCAQGEAYSRENFREAAAAAKLLRAFQPVTNSPKRFQVPGMARIAFNFLSQAPDVDVY